MKKSKLKGAAIDTISMNILLYGHGDPDMPNLPPNVLKEQYDITKPKFEGYTGTAIIVGTADSLDDNIWTKAIFYNEKS